MAKFNRIYKEISIALEGLKKGILEIAITTSENTQVAKLLFQVFELETKTASLYVEIGKAVHELRHLSIHEILDNRYIKDYISRIRGIRSNIRKLENAISLLRADSNKSRFDSLNHYMRRGGYSLDEIVVVKDSPVIGKEVSEISLPAGVMIISIIHHELFVIPDNGIRLNEGDRVMILGSRDRMNDAASLFSAAQNRA